VTNLRAILDVLVEHEVEFIVVGGVAGVLHGAPLHTEDLDVLYRVDDANCERLLAALEQLEASFRGDERRIRPSASHLASRGHKLLTTRFGDLDCLATIEENTSYDDIVSATVRMTIGSADVAVLSLPRLIEVKEKLSRPKDQLALLHLRATLDEQGKRRT
jgi:hypothetical protein